MADVIHFVPRSDITAAENIAAFVSLARDTLTAFGHDLRFDDDIWDITDAADMRALTHRIRISFCTLSSVEGKSPISMREPFREFAFPRAEGQPANHAMHFLDYVFLSFTTATAFSPTDTSPLTTRARMLMMVESIISLVVIAIAAARAINILPT